MRMTAKGVYEAKNEGWCISDWIRPEVVPGHGKLEMLLLSFLCGDRLG